MNAVSTGAIEMRGGNGYIEDWRNAKLVRDAHLGVLWEGTSSVNALEIVRKYCVTPETQGAALSALSFKCDVLWSMLDAIDQAYGNR